MAQLSTTDISPYEIGKINLVNSISSLLVYGESSSLGLNTPNQHDMVSYFREDYAGLNIFVVKIKKRRTIMGPLGKL